MLKLMLQGIVVGIANIIPGVSGGTMMVAMGLYDRLIHAITHLRKEFKESMKLLVPIFIGAGLALVSLARVIEFSLKHFPIPTNFLFCGLICGSLPIIGNKIKGKKITVGKVLAFLVFFAIVVGMALVGETGGHSADVSFGFLNVIKLFLVGVIAAATMVVPGVSGSMMLMLLGYYQTIIEAINKFVNALIQFDIHALVKESLVLVPFGIGVVVGIFAIAKLIEFIFERAETHAYYAIMGLIVASPVAILFNTDWSGFTLIAILISFVTFMAGWFIARKLGE